MYHDHCAEHVIDFDHCTLSIACQGPSPGVLIRPTLWAGVDRATGRVVAIHVSAGVDDRARDAALAAIRSGAAYGD